MAPRLIGERGLLTGLELELIGGPIWTLGRDPAEVDFVLEDPSVSRRQAQIEQVEEGYRLSNLSHTHPTLWRDNPLQGPVLLSAGDPIQLGGTRFRFEPLLQDRLPPREEVMEEGFSEEQESSEEEPPAEPPLVSSEQEDIVRELAGGDAVEELPSRDTLFEIEESEPPTFLGEPQWRYLLKVLSGPNQGAEFGLQIGEEYLLGKDPARCAFVLNDLAVSRQQCRFEVSEEGQLSVEDLGSRNGTLVDGVSITSKTPLHAHSIVQIGTSTLAVFDRAHAGETIIHEVVLPTPPPAEEAVEEELVAAQAAVKKDWKDLPIPLRNIYALLGIGGAALAVFIVVLALLRVEPIELMREDPEKKIAAALSSYPGVQFSYNQAGYSLFLLGHVLTPMDLQEMSFALQQLPFITEVENYVIADSNIWQEMNLLLARNPEWAGVTMYAQDPGKFIITGAVADASVLQSLQDYLNINFSFRDRLDMRVVVQSILQDQVHAMLVQAGLANISSSWDYGQLVLRGSIPTDQKDALQTAMTHLRAMPGVNSIDNLVLIGKVTGSDLDASSLDVSSKYKITGWIQGPQGRGVVINGSLYFPQDQLDDMRITAIDAQAVQLVKDGVEYKIKYNGANRGG